MSWLFQINLEPLLLETTIELISKMTNNNHQGTLPDDYYPDDIAFENNVKLGFLTLTALSAYFESFLSSIFFETRTYSEEEKQKFLNQKGVVNKLKFLMDSNDYTELKESTSWRKIDTARKIRNSLVHYNQKISGMCGWPDIYGWTIEGEIVGYYFTQSSIAEVAKAYESFSQIICDKLQIEIYPAQFLDADGRTGICGYVFNPSLLEQETLDEIHTLRKEIQQRQKKPISITACKHFVSKISNIGLKEKILSWSKKL